MAKRNPDTPNRVGIPDPPNEPQPPKLDIAGKLGPVGERKQEEAGLKDKDGIWRDPNATAEEEPPK
ncbi:MAG TPA: hypothetical protein VI356_15765 [Myxococcales bacterium]